MREPALTSAQDAAAFWDARLRSPLCTSHDLIAFEAWRDARPEHADAYAALQAGLDMLRQAYSGEPALHALRDEAVRLSRRRVRQYTAAAAAGLVAMILAGAGLWSYAPDPLPLPLPHLPAGPGHTAAPTSFQTAAGGRSDVVLSDGSKITLNTRSRVETTYTAHRRTVRLIEGEALFEVAKDAARPFEVIVGGQRVVAVGTAFDIRLDPKRVQLTMIEGKVKVTPAKAVGRPVATGGRQLVAGQRLYASTETDASWTETVDPATALLWRDGKIEFDRTPLAEAVAEMNRYSSTQIVLEDPSVAGQPISGMFFTGKPESFATSLAAYFPLQVVPDGDRIALRRARKAPS